MPRYIARIEYTDVKVITIEADDEDEAEARFEAGDWDSEDTVDYYSNRVVSPLRLAKE